MLGGYTAVMKVSGSATVFQVSNLEAALNFYCDVLGFEEDFRFGPYAGVHLGEFCLHLCAHTTWSRPIGGAMAGVFADEVDVYCAEIQQRGARIKGEPADQEYGMREFVVSDPDGNLLTFGCPLPESGTAPA
jgi:catechol 2,3-dioxygenase-like lactoylglutathione lyase family enzyme